MVSVNVKLLDRSSGASASDSIRFATLNAAAAGYADKLKAHMAGRECSVHSPGHGTITVVADLDETLRVEKSGFCCPAFEGSLEFTIKK
jgi:hypothetical protein